MLVMKRLAEGCEADIDDLNSLNTCTTCGICTENCPSGVDPPRSIEGARSVLASSGTMTDKQSGLSIRANFSGNVLGDSSSRIGWLRDQRGLPHKADLVYFVGCLASYRYPQMAAKTFDILRRFGAALLPDEKCCGSPLLRTGFDAGELMNSNISR
jgi:Fe-S oxidoreductase